MKKIDIAAKCLEWFTCSYPLEVDPDGRIRTIGSVRMKYPAEDGKLPVRFSVTGDFYIQGMNISDLEGCPDECQTFWAASNPLTDLRGGPQHVSGDYIVNGCGLTRLDGIAKYIYADLRIFNNSLDSLDGLADVNVHSYVLATDNPITRLRDLPRCYQIMLTWSPRIPVLRMVVNNKRPEIRFSEPSIPPGFNEIMDRYENQGPGALSACATELIKAGFRGNAKL